MKPKEQPSPGALPARGNRRAQDALWLARIRQGGIARDMPSVPDPPTEFFRGIEEFNHGAYFDSHETLEDIWRKQEYPLRLFYHGLIKVAVGLLHQERHNARGARSLLGSGLELLEPFLPFFMGLRLDLLASEVRQRLQVLGAAPPTPWEALDSMPRARILYQLSAHPAPRDT